MSALREITGRAEAATSGPWFRDSTTDDGMTIQNVTARLWAVACCPGGDAHPDHGRGAQASADADFIAHARTDVPKLVAALEAVEGLCEQDFMMSPEQIRQAIAEALA